MTGAEAAVLLSETVAAHAAGDAARAVDGYRRILEDYPDAAPVWVGLAAAWRDLDRPGEAEEACRRALDLDPDCLDALNTLGVLLGASGRMDQAVRVLERAVALAPDRSEPLGNLGIVLLDRGDPAAAIAACRRSLMLASDNPQVLNTLGNALVEMGQTDEAAVAFRQALALDPGFAGAGANLSALLLDDDQPERALALCRDVLAREPAAAPVCINMGHALRRLGRDGEAEISYRRAIALDPGDAEAHFPLGEVLLRQGRFREGWAEYEWRRQDDDAFPALAVPEWGGEAPAGRTILLVGEQGLGDMVQFCRFALPLAAAGARVVLRVPPPLVRLLATVPGVAGVVSTAMPGPDVDCHVPMMSLPRILGVELDSVPAPIPYLTPDPADVARWWAWLAARREERGKSGPAVGLVWAGGARPHRPAALRLDRRRSLALSRLAPLLARRDVTMVSLQAGEAGRQIEAVTAELRPLDPMGEVVDFADTAAIVANLDLVISVDTAVAHVAGAMGKPVWILSRFDGCWRWLADRDDSPWYPTARLYRQPAPGAWEPALAALGADLAAHASV